MKMRETQRMQGPNCRSSSPGKRMGWDSCGGGSEPPHQLTEIYIRFGERCSFPTGSGAGSAPENFDFGLFFS